jgi:hypothetical protein
MTAPVPTTPVMRVIMALDPFGSLDRRTAATLLDSWVCRSRLTAAEVRAVLAHYPLRRRAGR